jgi:hypothetical protein
MCEVGLSCGLLVNPSHLRPYYHIDRFKALTNKLKGTSKSTTHLNNELLLVKHHHRLNQLYNSIDFVIFYNNSNPNPNPNPKPSLQHFVEFGVSIWA